MKKIIYLFIALIIVYTGVWWKCADIRRGHVIGQLEEWKAHALPGIHFEYESVSLAGYPFRCSTALNNPKISYSAGEETFEAGLKGYLSIGKKLWGREHTVKQVGVIHVNSNFADHRLVLESKTHLTLNFMDLPQQHEDFEDFLKNLHFSSIKFSMENGYIADMNGQKLVEIASLKTKISETKEKDLTSRFYLDFDLEGLTFSNNLIPLLNDDSVEEKLMLDSFGKIDTSFSITAQLPPKDLLKKFFDKPSAKTLPDFKIDIAPFKSSSNLTSNRGEMHLSFTSGKEERGNLKFNFDQAGEMKKGLADYLKHYVELSKRNAELNKEKALSYAMIDTISRRLTPELPIEEHSSVEFLASYDKTKSTTYTDFLSILESFKVDVGIEKWGALTAAGKFRQKEPEWVGEINLSIAGIDKIINTYVSFYNTMAVKFEDAERKFPDQAPHMYFLTPLTDKQVIGIKNFIKKFSLDPQDFESRMKTSVVFDGPTITIAGKPPAVFIEAWEKFVHDYFPNEEELPTPKQ